MTCGGRVYKGDELEFTLPFNISGASNIVVSFYTDGEYAIEKSVEAVSGKIETEIAKTDLDLLSDGVIRYTITYEADGEEHSITSNTPNYLRTPAGYSAITADDIYQSGYTAGREDCSGSTECRIQTKVFAATDKNMENIFPDDGYDGMGQVMLITTNVYNSGYTDGYAAGQEACSGDCSEEIAEAYQSGYTAGQEACSGLINGNLYLYFDLQQDCEIDSLFSIYPSHDMGQGYHPWSNLVIDDVPVSSEYGILSAGSHRLIAYLGQPRYGAGVGLDYFGFGSEAHPTIMTIKCMFIYTIPTSGV